MAPKKFTTRKGPSKGKRPPGVPVKVQPVVHSPAGADDASAEGEVEASPAAGPPPLQEGETSFEGQYNLC